MIVFRPGLQAEAGGNMNAIGPIIGSVMKATQGRADGGKVTRTVRERLGL